MQIKKIISLCLLTIILSANTLSVYAIETPTVWAYNETDNIYTSAIQDTISSHVPEHTIKSFNNHQGEVVISAANCDSLGIAGLTNGEPTKTGWYRWVDGKTYVDLTPTYGLHTMQETSLHEFGHVFDMETIATNNPGILAIIRSELPKYNALEIQTGYMIPPIKNEHELFAQVFAAVVSNNDGTVNNSKEIIETCPLTARYINGMLKLHEGVKNTSNTKATELN